MEDAGLMLYDPFIGYLVAIAATIQLEHTVSKHSDVAASAKLSVKGAIRYLRKLSKYWRSTENLVKHPIHTYSIEAWLWTERES